MRLRGKLFLILATVVAFGSGTLFVLLRGSAESILRSYVLEGDLERARLYARAAADYYAARGGWEGFQAYLEARGPAPFHDRITLADEGGMVVADTGKSFLGTAHPERHLAKGEPVLVEGRRVGTLMAGSMVDSSLGYAGDRFLAAINRAILAGVAASAAAALALGALLAGALARPIRELTAASARVAAGDFAARVPVAGDDELSRLGASFNAMTAELAASEEERRRIVADAAHELRTPLTLLRGTVEAMLDGIYPADRETLASLLEETDRLARLVESLRELELIDSGRLHLDLDRLAPEEALRGTAASFRAAAREAGVELLLELDSSGPPAIRADALRLGEVLGILLENALRYAAGGGRILLRAGRSPHGGALISVEDGGPGIPETERERVFERFYRLEKSRSSAGGGRGLGLAIAREIVRAHGGELRCRASARLGGAAFELELPAASAG